MPVHTYGAVHRPCGVANDLYCVIPTLISQRDRVRFAHARPRLYRAVTVPRPQHNGVVGVN